MKAQTCCFTGHRHIPEDELTSLLDRLSNQIENLIHRGYKYFGCGRGPGFDMLAAQAVFTLKSKYPEIALILVLPCRDQARKWSKIDICKYEYIKSHADKIVYTAEKYFKGCMYLRNRHLVDSSSVCICYLKKGGGTAFTVGYAKECEIDVVNIAGDANP